MLVPKILVLLRPQKRVKQKTKIQCIVDWALRTGAQEEIIENLQEIEDEGEIYERIEDLWPDYPSKDDFFFNEDEY